MVQQARQAQHEGITGYSPGAHPPLCSQDDQDSRYSQDQTCTLEEDCTAIGTVLYRPRIDTNNGDSNNNIMRANLLKRANALGLICPSHYLELKQYSGHN